MNCRQGKLAYVANPSAIAYGHVVTCLKPLPPGSDGWHPSKGPIWEIDKPLPISAGWMVMGKVVDSHTFPDEAMRPIDDPGEDAVDQMVERVGPAPAVKTDSEVTA